MISKNGGAYGSSIGVAEKVSSFLVKVRAFNGFESDTVVYEKMIDGQEVPFFVNEFWTSKQRAAHSLHEVSYRACFKPQLPRFFIEGLTHRGDMVYDPFMGRGTTVLEAAFLGRSVLGNDINPLSKIFCAPRLAPPTLEAVSKRLSEIPLDREVVLSEEEVSDLSVFYHSSTLRQICALREYLLERQKSNQLGLVDQWIQMVATNRLTGHSAGFFSVYTLPPNQAVTAVRQRKINEKRQQTPEPKEVSALILKKTKSLLSKLTSEEEDRLSKVESLLGTAPAEKTGYISSDSVDLVVTSPPFLDVVDYKSDNWLRCWFNGIDASSLPISQLSKPDDWVKKMADVFDELARVNKEDGVIAFEVGEIKGGKILLEELVVEAAHEAGLFVCAVIINAHQFTKTANCWGVDNDKKGTNTNRIVLLTR